MHGFQELHTILLDLPSAYSSKSKDGGLQHAAKNHNKKPGMTFQKRIIKCKSSIHRHITRTIYSTKVNNKTFLSYEVKTKTEKKHFSQAIVSVSDMCQTIEHSNTCWTHIEH